MPALTWMHCISQTDPSWYGLDCASKGKANNSMHTTASAEAILLIVSLFLNGKGVVQSEQNITEPPTLRSTMPPSRRLDCSLLTTSRKEWDHSRFLVWLADGESYRVRACVLCNRSIPLR